jgi:putative phosphoesterase
LKLLIISDVHANIAALESVYKKEPHPDKIICAGDLLDYGTHPKAVIAWMREHKVEVVAGNHDLQTLAVYESGEWRHIAPDDFRWIHYTCERLQSSDIDYIRALPMALCFSADGIDYIMRHQYKPQSYEVIESKSLFNKFWRENQTRELKNTEQKRMIFGHTHRRCVHYLEDTKLWLNPGSVSYRRPDDDDKNAHYAVIEDGRISLRETGYDRKVSFVIAEGYWKKRAMKESELRDAFFFFSPFTEFPPSVSGGSSCQNTPPS